MFRSVATPLPNPLPKGEGIKTLLADGLSTQRRVRTASDSDRIIFHFSFSIYHWPFGGFTCHRIMSNNEQMKNAKWKMINDPVATARGSDTSTLAARLPEPRARQPRIAARLRGTVRIPASRLPFHC